MTDGAELDKNRETIIRTCLLRAGLLSLPEDCTEELEAYGFDSLILALFVIELERETGKKFNVSSLQKRDFLSIATILFLVRRTP